MIYHVFCFDFDFPAYDSYLGWAESFEGVKTLIANRSDVTSDFAHVFAFDSNGTKDFTLAAQWYFGGGMYDMDADGWRILRPDLIT